MECVGLVQWLAAEVVASLLDAALVRIRVRILVLQREARRCRARVNWLWGCRQREQGSRAYWDSELLVAEPAYDRAYCAYRRLERQYRSYRVHQNARWGLDGGARWRDLPALARRGYPPLGP